jgi:Ca2+-transporting ATPase
MTSNAFDIGEATGLSLEEAAQRLKSEGYNEIPSTKRQSIWSIAFSVIREPMFLLLIAGGSIYFALGNIEEAVLLLSFVFVIMGITFYQERKTERALEALRDLSSPRALVIRGGRERRIPGRDVVRGDLIVVSEGDRVPADAVLIASTNLSVDESFLTGESVPVRKKSIGLQGNQQDKQEGPSSKQNDSSTEYAANTISGTTPANATVGAGLSPPIKGHPGGEDQPFLYSGTLVVQGQGYAEVTATGVHTEMGKIGRTLQTLESESTPMQKKSNVLVRNLAIVAFGLFVIIVFAYALTRGSWLNGLLAGITLAMATIPEEIPVVLTIFLALGAWRISKQGVLTRRIPAVEALGSATVLCVDKTGTLTQNRMIVKELLVNGDFYDVRYDSQALPERFHSILEYSILASQRDPFDPMEKAFKELGDHFLAHTEHLHADWSLVHEYPLSPELLAISRVWRSPDRKEYIIAAKGAPEAIADLCHFDAGQMKQLKDKINEMAGRGLRVLGVAKASFSEPRLPSIQHEFDFKFLGLIGLADPIRETVPLVLSECYQAGIRVVMITGDYPGTAESIARQIGLRPPDKYITGAELDKMSDEELRKRAADCAIFARVVPEQKLRIVNALKANGEVVAMTGDGVNDAPALKAADIGVAMGGRGTDVAREAASLVLLNDDFASIVHAVKLGRTIFDNLQKALSYIFAIHIPIVGMSLIPVLFDLPLVLLPAHIVFLELIIDPACSVVFEAEPAEPDVMQRPPRDPNAPLFGRRDVLISVMQGLSVLVIVLIVFRLALSIGQNAADARAITFSTLIFANLALINTNRSRSQTILASFKVKNSALWWVMGGATLFLLMVLYIPFLRSLFSFTILHPASLLIALVAGAAGVAWFEVLKYASYRRV